MFKLKSSNKGRAGVGEERLATPEPVEVELMADESSQNRIVPSLSDEPESFLLPSASCSVSRPPLPSLLEVTGGGGVIAPPKLVGRRCEIPDAVESLEQTPLDLDSSEDSSCHSTPGKDQEIPGKTLEAPRPSSEKSRTPETQESSWPLPKKPRLSSEETIKTCCPKKRNLTRTFSHHHDNNTCTTINTKSPRKSLNPSRQHTSSQNNHHQACILFNDHPPTEERGSSQEKEWEESEGSQSPSIIPLTPGKEAVNSILHRRNLTLF